MNDLFLVMKYERKTTICLSSFLALFGKGGRAYLAGLSGQLRRFNGAIRSSLPVSLSH